MTSNEDRAQEDAESDQPDGSDDAAPTTADGDAVADILGRLNNPFAGSNAGVLDFIRESTRVPDIVFKIDPSRDLPKLLHPLGTPRYDKVEIPEVTIDDSKWRTATASEATAEAAARTAEYTAGLLEAMRRSVELNEETRTENIRARRWSIGIGIASIVVAAGSLAAAIIAIGLSAGNAQVAVPEVVMTDAPAP